MDSEELCNFTIMVDFQCTLAFGMMESSMDMDKLLMQLVKSKKVFLKMANLLINLQQEYWMKIGEQLMKTQGLNLTGT